MDKEIKKEQTKGYLELRGQLSIATIILFEASASDCLVSILIFGIRFSAGMNKCLVL